MSRQPCTALPLLPPGGGLPTQRFVSLLLLHVPLTTHNLQLVALRSGVMNGCLRGASDSTLAVYCFLLISF